MQWPDLNAAFREVPLPQGYRYCQLRRVDVPALRAAIAEWHPDVSVGAASCYLEQDFYETTATFADEAQRDLLVVLAWKGEELAGFVSWDREPAQQAVYGRFGVVSPAHRGAKISTCAMQLGEAIARAMGAGFIYTLATLKVASMQLALEHAGYQLLGIAPGYDRERVAPGVVKRVYEAWYAKVLVPESELLRPDPAKMTPKTRELFQLLFPHLFQPDEPPTGAE
ncbi:GNAT family N-acetyltransferase [Ottowia sp.]|jgi:hypothetical protein|uniref:GNAT family N-acetyltransferase n=1 Tax=Ottowia sp. TaxID=1898956 RepID=UPI0025FD9E36|nr:GNAT family N-acetyltransferase [Ottowia sp.]MBK6615253.1 GNAT family N-acetyltransferase [Ottowia sp.]